MVEDKLYHVHNMDPSGLRKMLSITISNTSGVLVLVHPAIFMDTGIWQPHYNGSSYSHSIMSADVMP